MKTTRATLGVLACLAALAWVAGPSEGAVIFQETFPTDTANTAETVATYTNFTYSGGGNAFVSSGVLNFSGTSTANNLRTVTGFVGDLLLQLDVGKNPGGSSANVGLGIGANRLVFHPGYSGGAFRVEGPGGFGNRNMGFTPAAVLLHPMDVALNAATGEFTIAVTNAANPTQVFAAKFTNAGYAPGTTTLGPTRSTGGGNEVGLYDDLVVSELRPAMANTPWTVAVRNSDPLHWYRMNEVGTAIAVDYGRGGLNGVYRNGTLQGQPGIPFEGDLAAQFDGWNDEIWLGAPSLAGPWSAEFVLNHLGVEAAGTLIRSGAGALRLDQWHNTGEVGFTAFGVADYRLTPAVIAPLDKWVHLAFVADPVSGMQVYLNGVPAGANPNYIPLPRDLIGGGSTANMLLDELVLYDRLLTPHEILTHASGVGIPEPATLALLGAGLLALARSRRRAQRN